MNVIAPLAPADPRVDTRLNVPGIRCAGCIAKIERALGAIDGVSQARVNLSGKRVAVRHSVQVGEDRLVEALRQLGFEAQVANADLLDGEKSDSKRLMQALAVAGFGMMNVMLLSVSVWSGAGEETRNLFHWLSGMIAVPVVAYSGRPFFSSALKALRHRRTNMDVPISIGVLLATGLSLYETVTHGDHAYFDGAVMLLFFLLSGRALDVMMRDRARAGIGALLSRMGRTGGVVQPDGSVHRVPAAQLQPGMQLLVAAGETLAADGIVEEGTSAADLSMLTGESVPQPVVPGSKVFAGTINMMQPIRVRVTAAAGDTALAEISRLMDEAGQSRSRYMRIADRASRLYAPAVHTLAALAFIGWMMAGAGWHQSLVIAIAVLIITCPCAMGLAVPAAQVVASNALLKAGLLVKDGSALERLAEVDVALFDKTGTLTRGEPVARVSDLTSREKQIALGLAQHSRHPLSQALVRTLSELQVVPAAIEQAREEGGAGVRGLADSIPVALERPEEAVGSTAALLRVGGSAKPILFEDRLRSDAAEVIADCRTMGLNPSILSGDGPEAVRAAGDALGVAGKAGLRPADKLQLLEQLKKEGRRPLMIGDGLNDGPALAAAHASIAPGTAGDASQQAADAVFIGSRLIPVALAVQVARRTMQIVRQNFAFAIGYNLLAVPLALAGLVTPLIAAVAMSLSSVVVIGNSLRLARSARSRG